MYTNFPLLFANGTIYFFADLYFSLWRSRQRTHLVASPFSPKPAQGRKFLHPLHHLISIPFDVMTQIVTSHAVHSPLFCFGIMWAVPSSFSSVLSSPLLLLPTSVPLRATYRPLWFCIRLAAEQIRSLPHMTQFLRPSVFDVPFSILPSGLWLCRPPLVR